MSRLDLFLEDLVKAKRGRKPVPVGTKSPDGSKVKAVDGWKWVKNLSPTQLRNLERRAPKTEPTIDYSKVEGAIRWNSTRKIKEIRIRGKDGKMKDRKYVGKQRPGGKATKVETEHYKLQEVSPGRQKTQEGLIRVNKDGTKDVAIREKNKKIRWHEYIGGGKDKETVSEEEINRVKRYLAGDEPAEYPADYSDLIPYDPPATIHDTSKPPLEIQEFSDDLPLEKLLKKVSDLRYEIILSRTPGSKTRRPWFKHAVVQIEKRFFKVRHVQNLSFSGDEERSNLRRYVLSPSDRKAWKNRPLRILNNKDYYPGQVLKTMKTRESFVVAHTERRGKAKFAIFGRVLPDDKIEEAKSKDPIRAERIKQKKAQREENQERQALFQFKQGVVKGEDRSFWDILEAGYEMDRQDLITDVHMAQDSLSAAKAKGMTDRTIRARESKLESAQDKLEGFRFDPYSVVKRLATDVTGGYWLDYKGRVFYYHVRDFSTKRTTATRKMVREAVKNGILRKF